MKQKKESFFWTSYSDLMTSLFFVMLVLFVLVIVLLHQNAKATAKELAQIKKIEKSVRDLNKKNFLYDEKNERFSLRMTIKFNPLMWNISDPASGISQGQKTQLVMAGRDVAAFLSKHQENKYLVIIEGQASKDNYADNYGLSYKRSLNLLVFWHRCNISFPGNGEILIAGSGDGQIPTNSTRDEFNNSANQRFLIHIIPKNVIRDEE